MNISTRIIPVAPDVPHPLGRHVEHWDESKNYPYVAKVTAPAPVMHPHHGVTLNQGQLGSCTGNASAQSLMTGPLYRSNWNATEARAVAIYKLATQLDGVPGVYPPTDTGSTGVGAAKACQQKKYITSYQHVFGIDHAKLSIAITPFIVGTEWFDGMFNPDANGTVHPTGSVAGGHEYLCLGYDGSNVWTFLNSWGTWGIGLKGIATTGLFHMSTADFAMLLANQGDITVFVR